jgi:hypothetical protein
MPSRDSWMWEVERGSPLEVELEVCMRVRVCVCVCGVACVGTPHTRCQTKHLTWGRVTRNAQSHSTYRQLIIVRGLEFGNERGKGTCK